jgi:hypothetical protein
MKSRFNKYILKALATVPVLMLGCTYDFPEPDPSTVPSKGTADFTKFVSVGNSLTAGLMDNALYNRSQQNSFPAIMATQFALVGGGEFNQPTVNSENGCSNPAGGCNQGRLHFAYVNGAATILPKTGDGGAALQAYAGDKSELNNFGVPGVTIQTALLGATGGPATANPYFNPYYARIASNPGTSTLVGDAAAAMADGGTFFSFWLGNNDVLGYATGGGSNPTLLTSEVNFQAAYTGAINAMLNANANAKGVVGNIPDVTSIPFFKTVAYNVVNFSAANPVHVGTVDALNSNFSGLNSALDAIVAYLGHEPADAARRKVQYATGSNPILIYDESLTDLTAEFDQLRAANAIDDAQRAALQPYVQSRPATSTDLIALSGSSVIGTGVGGSTTIIYGVSYPLPDQYVLIPTEIAEITARTTAFNAIIADAVADNASRLALVDANFILKNLPASIGGIGSTSSLQPPFGIFSADGVHPNARGSAFMANQFILAINAKFDANVPLVNPNNYPGNDLPVNP